MNNNQLSFVDTLIKLNDLILSLKKSKRENRLKSRLKHFAKYKLPIIGEIGYLPIDADDAELFFQLIDLWYEKKEHCTILTTNSNFKALGEIFQDPKIANAILDRFLHHTTVVHIVGDSYRFKRSYKKKNKNFTSLSNWHSYTVECVHAYLDIYINTQAAH